MAFVRVGALWIAEIDEMAPEFGRWDPSAWGWDESRKTEGISDGGGRYGSMIMGYARSSWFPDGRRIAVETRRWNGASYSWIDILRLESNGLAKKLHCISTASAPSVSPDGHHLVYQTFQRSDLYLECLDLLTGGVHRLVTDATSPACNPTLAAWWRRFSR